MVPITVRFISTLISSFDFFFVIVAVSRARRRGPDPRAGSWRLPLTYWRWRRQAPLKNTSAKKTIYLYRYSVILLLLTWRLEEGGVLAEQIGTKPAESRPLGPWPHLMA